MLCLALFSMLEISLSIALDGHLFWYLFLWGLLWFILFHFYHLIMLSLSRAHFVFLAAIKGKLSPRDGPHPGWISGTCFSSSLSHHRDAKLVVPFCTQQKPVGSFITSTTLMFPPAECQQTPQDLNADLLVQASVRRVYKSFLCIQVGPFAHCTSSGMAWSDLHGQIFC